METRMTKAEERLGLMLGWLVLVVASIILRSILA